MTDNAKPPVANPEVKAAPAAEPEADEKVEVLLVSPYFKEKEFHKAGKKLTMTRSEFEGLPDGTALEIEEEKPKKGSKSK